MIDVEAVLIAWLEANVEDVRASTETPPDLDGRLPWLQVVRVSGPYDGYRLDRPVVDIDTFASDGPSAAALALQVQDLLHSRLRGAVADGAVFSRVRTDASPRAVPYDNPAMRRYAATNSFVIHPA